MCCVVLWAVLITIGVLLIFLVRVPTASVASTTIQCDTYADCTNYARTAGIPVQVNVSIHNPNILSAYVQSSDLVLVDRTTANSGTVIAPGSIARQYISSRSDSNVVAVFVFPADSTETTTVISTLYLNHQSYPINLNGHLHISVGALSFSYYINEDETIPAQ